MSDKRVKYVKVVWCAFCGRYVGKNHVCAAALPPPESVPLEDLRVP